MITRKIALQVAEFIYFWQHGCYSELPSLALTLEAIAQECREAQAKLEADPTQTGATGDNQEI